jgi:hypothetical protein
VTVGPILLVSLDIREASVFRPSPLPAAPAVPKASEGSFSRNLPWLNVAPASGHLVG